MRNYRSNPWFSPPALQYVARFTGNPPSPKCTGCGGHLSDQDMRHGSRACRHCSVGHVPPGSRYASNPPSPLYGSPLEYSHYQAPPGHDVFHNPQSPLYGSPLDYDQYQAPPGHDVFHNPPFKLGDEVTWSEDGMSIKGFRGSPRQAGAIMRVVPSTQTSVELPNGRTQQVNNWEIEHATQSNPWHRRNAPFKLGDKVTWSEEALDLEIGRPGMVMRVGSPSLHANDADRTRVELPSGRARLVNNWEIVLAARANPGDRWADMSASGHPRYHADPSYEGHDCPVCWTRECQCGPGFMCEACRAFETTRSTPTRSNPWFSPPALQYVARFTGNPQERHDALCQCGWGRLAVLESEIPDYCPVCSSPVGICDGCEERKGDCVCGEPSGRHPLLDHYREQGLRDAEDPDYDGRLYDNNPSNGLVIRGRSVPVEHSAGGKYHHVRVADPDEFKSIRTKTLSAKKGIKARVGIFAGRGPRGGKTEIQSYLFDAKKYTPQDVARWIEAHRTPEPILVEISQVGAKSRRLITGTASEAPTKLRKKVKAKKKRKPRKVPADAKRCTAKGKNGRCKGYKQAGKTQCALHAAGVAGKRQPKKRKKRKVG